jgi:8-oxo-dGTP pyrophosphatase MutT (NUDIX family)
VQVLILRIQISSNIILRSQLDKEQWLLYSKSMKKFVGIGVVLQTPASTLLLQERDNNTKLHPGRIATFGGGIENNETVQECAIREIYEELNYVLRPEQLESIGDFEFPNEPNNYVHLFLVRNIDPATLTLQEGRSIQELSLEKALAHEEVTDLTKEILRSIKF